MLYLFFISFAVSTQTTVSVTVHYGLSVNVWKSSEGPRGLTSVLENGIDGFAKYCLGHFVCFCRNLHRRKSLEKKKKKLQQTNKKGQTQFSFQSFSSSVGKELWGCREAVGCFFCPEISRISRNDQIHSPLLLFPQKVPCSLQHSSYHVCMAVSFLKFSKVRLCETELVLLCV